MAETKDSRFKGYYLTRVYGGKDPCTTVMDLFRDDAIAVCEQVAPHRSVDSPGQAAYHDARVKVEDWLRDSAKENGVDIRAKNPVYFALTDKPEVSVPGRQVISIPAEQVDMSACSFTFKDSFVNYGVGRNPDPNLPPEDIHPMAGKVLNADQAAEALKIHGTLGAYKPAQSYVEVQMWDRPQHKFATAAAPKKKRRVSPSPAPDTARPQ